MHTEPAILRPADCARYIGVNRSTVWRMVQAGTFPKPIKTYGRSRGFLRSEIDDWIASRPRAA